MAILTVGPGKEFTTIQQAVVAAKTGDTVEYDAPNGKKLQVVIVDAVPFTG